MRGKASDDEGAYLPYVTEEERRFDKAVGEKDKHNMPR